MGEVGKRVRELMVSGQGNMLRVRTMRRQNGTKAAMGECGSSLGALAELAQLCIWESCDTSYKEGTQAILIQANGNQLSV
ncbi:hypothetical protein IFM89_025669 [Coptis chinensis]|uniref:Uncharacterized protein n=1 Tax=Coptis chinensis TaxID=261450 RepID=A0A835HBH0_9MAGN|nr:hypothetical protein IFM89_025669 [Coptis chinensis]